MTESSQTDPSKSADVPSERSPWRLRLGLKSLEMVSRAIEGKIGVTGFEHLDDLNKFGKSRIVIAVPHELDSDVTIPASVLINNKDVERVHPFKIKISDISSHHSLRKQIETGSIIELLAFLGQRLAGENNFLPIDYGRNEGMWRASPFNAANTIPMVENIQSGKADILIAAYNPPPNDQPINKRTPGIAAAYVSELTQVPVLPIQVLRHGKRQVMVSIGEPIKPGGIEVKELQRILTKRQQGQKLETDEFQKAKEVIELLRVKSEQIMQRVLPE